MASFKKLQNLTQTARLVARDKASDLDAVHASIYDLAIHGFMSEVLTLGRMTRVVQAVSNGIKDSTNQTPDTNVSNEAMSLREAYRGLCAAATEGLAAAGLAHAEFRKFNGENLSTEFSKALLQEILAYKLQLDQITIEADWPPNNQINHLQVHWFSQFFQHIVEQDSKQEKRSGLHWNYVFFQLCGYEAKTEKSDIQANLMLLGLITSGALTGFRASQAIA
jgi:hypothetical protein